LFIEIVLTSCCIISLVNGKFESNKYVGDKLDVVPEGYMHSYVTITSGIENLVIEFNGKLY
jgi:hypothetical protein